MSRKTVRLSNEYFIAVVVSVICGVFWPDSVSWEILNNISCLSVICVSILFSVFFASSSAMITSSDSKFSLFLEEDGFYSKIVRHLRFNTRLIVVAMLASIFVYLTSIFMGSEMYPKNNDISRGSISYVLCIFYVAYMSFTFTYTFSMVKNIMIFLEKRFTFFKGDMK